MVEWYEESDTLGSASRVPFNTWFGVNTDTGVWDLPASTPVVDRRPRGFADTGSTLPDWAPPDPSTLGRVPLPGPWAAPTYAPETTPTIGSVAGTSTPVRSPILDRRGVDLASLQPRQPTVWESIARGIGMLSPQGQAILQGYDQQQQQELRNRVALRDEQRREAETTRRAKETFLTNMEKIGKVGNTELQTLLFNRAIAEYQAIPGVEPLPADFVETYRKANAEKRKQLGEFLTPLLTAAGMDAEKGIALLANMDDPKPLLDAIDLRTKQQKVEREAGANQAVDAIVSGQTLGEAGGTTLATPAPTAPTQPGAPTTTAAPRSGQSVIDTALADNSRLFNVRLALLHGIARHESNYNAEAKGPVTKSGERAEGVMQLMPGTARDMGVENTMDAQQNIRGGTRYFAQLLSKYNGNEALALAAYNWGPGNVDKVGGDLTKMPAETQAYVKNVLASAAAGERGPAETSRQVAGTGAPAVSPAAQAGLTALDREIAANKDKIAQLEKIHGEYAKQRRDELVRENDRLQTRRDKLEERLTEGQRALEKQQLLQPGQKELAEAQRALTPIPDTTQKSLAANKSIYRSIGKIEQYFREGTDLPEDFVNQVAADAPGIRAQLQADPKNATGILQQWELKLKAAAKNDPNANRFLSALANMRDLIIRERSGGSVTGNELERATGAFMGSLPNINQAFSLFVQNLANIKETVVDELVTAGSSARPLAGGKAVYGSLPKEVRDRIDRYERGEYDEPAPKPPPTTTTTTTTTRSNVDAFKEALQ